MSEFSHLDNHKPTDTKESVWTVPKELQDIKDRIEAESKVYFATDILKLQGVFFNWAHPEFAKCRPVSNRFQKNDRVPDWAPL